MGPDTMILVFWMVSHVHFDMSSRHLLWATNIVQLLSPPARAPATLGHSSMFKHEWNITPWVGCLHSNDGLDSAHWKCRIISLRVNFEQGGNGSQKGGRQIEVFLFPSPTGYSKVQYLQATLPEKCHGLSEHSFWATAGLWQLCGRWKPGWKSSSLHSIHTFLGLLSLFLLHPIPWTHISQLNCYYANPCLGLCFIEDPIKTTSKWRCQARG